MRVKKILLGFAMAALSVSATQVLAAGCPAKGVKEMTGAGQMKSVARQTLVGKSATVRETSAFLLDIPRLILVVEVERLELHRYP